MGNSPSSPVYNQKNDPCSAHLESYLCCVESKKDGLKEGDECTTESNAYKKCRKEQRVRKSRT